MAELEVKGKEQTWGAILGMVLFVGVLVTPAPADMTLQAWRVIGASIGGLGTLIGTPPNAVLAAYMAREHGVTIGLAQWLALALPLVLVMLIGTWIILVRVRRCSAYYSEAGRSLRLAIRCRSAANQVEIRGLLTQQGGLLVGTWEERTFNVSGDASGRMTSGRINLSIMGGGFAGSMSVAYGGSRQSVVISIQGMSMQGVNITLTRS